MKLLFFKILATGCLFLAGLIASAQATKTHAVNIPAQQKQVDSLFVNPGKTLRPGAAILVVRNGTVLYKKGYGYANLEYDVSNSPSTVFHIASLSKQFTALSVLLLVKEGKLSLNDNVNKCLPEMQVFNKPVTILNLLNHTSGLREWIYLLGLQGYRLNDMFTREQIIKILSRQRDLNFDPGSKFMYVNSGYNLLAEIVARVSGLPFAEFVKQRIFIPLGMTHSLVLDNYETIVKNEAASYSFEGAKGYMKKTLSFVNVVGSTGVLTTAEDLSLWAENFETPKVGDAGVFAQMSRRGILTSGDTSNYAMGQFIGNYRGLKTIDHSGSDAGFRAHLLRFPEQKLSIIVLGNDASLNASGIAYKIADIYLKKDFKKGLPSTTQPSSVPSQIAGKIDSGAMIKYVGKYELQPGLIMDFMIEGKYLTVDATGQGKFVLQQISPVAFKINGVNATITFQKNEQGDFNNLKFEVNGQTMKGTRIKRALLSAENTAPFTGQFYSKELDISYLVFYDNGKLMTKSSRSDDIELTEVDKDTFSGNQWYMGIVKFIRDDKQIVTGFTVSTDRVEKLVFEKR